MVCCTLMAFCLLILTKNMNIYENDFRVIKNKKKKLKKMLYTRKRVMYIFRMYDYTSYTLIKLIHMNYQLTLEQNEHVTYQDIVVHSSTVPNK